MKPGQKFDADKLDWSLLPFKMIRPIIRVLMFGAKKYAPDDWQKVENARVRYLNAATRHMDDYQSGEQKDKDSGEHHLAHTVCCLLFIIWFDDKF
ncbi:MAG: hypothetical protein DRQ89_11655 [Epsilonproteobacteria bacterium]|nr:MAG: hypothetical protein DRQ89_11655 [Campylobacterota bacterium]